MGNNIYNLTKVYNRIAETREHVCTGCGISGVPLSHSHIIPRSRRRDLICEIKNITYHCLTLNGHIGCHTIWDDGTEAEKEMLLDYEINMKYIKSVDEQYYNLLLNRRFKSEYFFGNN